MMVLMNTGDLSDIRYCRMVNSDISKNPIAFMFVVSEPKKHSLALKVILGAFRTSKILHA